MPWSEQTIELQFIDRNCQQTVQHLEACRELKVTQEPLSVFSGLRTETSTSKHSDYSDSPAILKSINETAKLITARKPAI